MKFRAIFLCTLFLSLCGVLRVHADTASDLSDKIQNQNQAIAQLEREIAAYQEQLSNLGKQKDTLANAVKILNLEAQKLATDIRVSENKISATNLKLQSLGSSIQSTSQSIVSLRAAVAKNIREMDALDKKTFAELLVSKHSIADTWHELGMSETLRKQISTRATELSTKRTTLITSKSDVEKAKKELVALRAQLADQQTITKRAQADKNKLLKDTKNQEATYTKLVADKQALKSQMESDLRAYEAQLSYTGNPDLLPKTGSNTFIWPLDKVIITQLFGKTVAAKRLYTSGSHNGVDFGTPTGTPVKALASGSVIGSGNTDLVCRGASYGNWVFIKYDNGLASVYGHLSLVKATAGQRVSAGDVVAYSGASGYATGPHLHVSIFPNDAVNIASFPSKACAGRTITIPTAAANAYLDPMLYLPKR
jgi:murein DD-endopeptidase MepM/ murein hydrolase activator NlpD